MSVEREVSLGMQMTPLEVRLVSLHVRALYNPIYEVWDHPEECAAQVLSGALQAGQ